MSATPSSQIEMVLVPIIVDLRINNTLQTGGVRKTKLLFYRLVGAVSNCAYAVRVKTAPTGPDRSGSNPRGERFHLFLEFTLITEN